MNAQERYITMAGWTESRADNQLQAVYEAIYAEQVESEIAWNFAKMDCINNAPKNHCEDSDIGVCFLGSVFAIMPSGKYWTFWASGNVDRIEQIKDSAYMAALEHEAESRGMWVESGDGDPCDLYLACLVELD